MLVCRKGSDGIRKTPNATLKEHRNQPFKPGGGGPVFLPRRKPSMIAEALFASTSATPSSVSISENALEELPRVAG